MHSRSSITPFSKYLLLFLLVCIIFTITSTNAQVGNFKETRQPKRFAITSSSPHFDIDLDYEKAFEVEITSYNGKVNDTGFCDAYPSKISSKMEWTGPIGDLDGHSYDNIAYYKGYYFILDSITFNVIATQDLKKLGTFVTIESNFHNEVDANGAFDEPFMLIDHPNGVLYIITGKQFISYKISDFLASVDNGVPPPKIYYKADNYVGYESILNIVHYQRRIYIVADNEVFVYLDDLEGTVTPEITFGAEFFGVPDLAIVDIAFKGKYTFVLDKLNGVFLVDISKAGADEEQLPQRFKYIPDVFIKLSRGQFIEVVGDSVTLVSSATKNPFIYEYIIKGDPEILELTFNRKTELFQSVRDTYSDSNFIYILTGFFNLAVKHSIPERYKSTNVESYLTEYWPLFGAKAMTSLTSNSTSRVVAIQDNFVNIFRFSENNPIISCDTGDLDEGLYTYQIHGIQKDCDAKRNNTLATFNDVCEITENIELLVTTDGSKIGNIEESSKTVFWLTTGVAIMSVIVIIFLCFVRKYKNQYQRLEYQIKFKKIENDNTDQNIGTTGGRDARKTNSQEINPANINIQVELEKEAERERKKSPQKTSSPIKNRESPKEKTKPNAEFGDLKPLDLEDIYGGHKKDKDESF